MSYPNSPQTPIKTNDDKVICILAHVLGIVTWFVGALVIYFTAQSEEVKAHAREALNWQLTLLIYFGVSGILVFFIIGIFLTMALAVLNIVFCVVAAIKANDHILWPYPATIRFLK